MFYLIRYSEVLLYHATTTMRLFIILPLVQYWWIKSYRLWLLD
jgi:hypothetical protein